MMLLFRISIIPGFRDNTEYPKLNGDVYLYAPFTSYFTGKAFKILREAIKMKKEHTGQGAKGLKFKVPAAIVAIAMLAVAFAGFLPSASDGSDNSTLGAELIPYPIENADDLFGIHEHVASGTTDEYDYYLIDNIDLADEECEWYDANDGIWMPIGTSTNPFKGVFNGNGFTISGLSIPYAGATVASDYKGLFGYVDGGSIFNFTIKDFNITGRDYVGGVAGYVKGSTISVITVEDSSIFGNNNDVISHGLYVGGAAGYIEGSTISNASVTKSEVAGNNYVGGVAGYIEGSTISNASVTKSEVAGNNYVGGVVGYAREIASPLQNSEILNCYNAGTVDGNTYVGGVVGQVRTSIVNLCSNVGEVAGNDTNGTSIGGVVGMANRSSNVINCFNNGLVTGYSIGGVAGQLNNSDLYNSYNWGKVSGTNAAGVVGSSVAGGHIVNCYNVGEVDSGPTPLGGPGGSIVGNITGGGGSFCYYFEDGPPAKGTGGTGTVYAELFDGDRLTMYDSEEELLEDALNIWVENNGAEYSEWILGGIHPVLGLPFPVLEDLIAEADVSVADSSEGSGTFVVDPSGDWENWYLKGTMITITITPAEGSELSSVFMGEIEIYPEEDDGVFTYTFTLFDDTVITISFSLLEEEDEPVPPSGGPGKCLHYLLPLIIVSLILFALIFFGAKCRCKKDE
jgi:hypothetical protein